MSGQALSSKLGSFYKCKEKGKRTAARKNTGNIISPYLPRLLRESYAIYCFPFKKTMDDIPTSVQKHNIALNIPLKAKVSGEKTAAVPAER